MKSFAARSVERYSPFFKYKKAAKVLDYGAGKLRNSLFLAKAGYSVYAADLSEQVRWIRSCNDSESLSGIIDADHLSVSRLGADLVVSTYVFNIISDVREKSRYLANIVRNLRPEGYLLIEVRCRKRGADCSVSCSHFQKDSICTKSYSHEELDDLLKPLGFARICHYYRRNALAVVYQLMNS
jgi:SAM-dependent methyltransferase